MNPAVPILWAGGKRQNHEHRRQDWLLAAAEKRLREELKHLQVEVNEDKSRTVDLAKGESFGFLGFEFRRVRSRRGVWKWLHERLGLYGRYYRVRLPAAAGKALPTGSAP